MKVLVIGGGGREHAIVKSIAKSPRAEEIYCAPGNAGMAGEAVCVDVSAGDIDGLLAFADEKHIDFTVVGPEAPLCDGIVDRFQAEGLRIFGPNRAAAELEGSKVFAKTLMQKHLIPTASFRTFQEADDAMTWLRSVLDWPVVLKADGLAAGKGVIIAQDLVDADEAVRAIMEDRQFGEAGRQLVIEECLNGQEASVLAITDGTTIAVLEPSQDHKAAYDGDEGPNTGGMGAYCPAPVVDERVMSQISRDVLVPTVHALGKEGRPYRGVLYAGLMITKGGPKVLEFNVRFGDPETQAVLSRLKTDLLDLLEAAVDGDLESVELEWDPRHAMCVVMASGGYPGSYEKGLAISGLAAVADREDVIVHHAGTALVNGQLVTDGGRVLGVTGLGDTLAEARDVAYGAVEQISWPGVQYRKDIGYRAL